MLSLANPLFATYVVAATIMILKVVSMSWLTVVGMVQVKGGYRSPEDLRKRCSTRSRIRDNSSQTHTWIGSAGSS